MKNRMSGFQMGNMVMGDQIVSHATYDKIKVLGTLKADHCQYEQLDIMGNATLQDCFARRIMVNGELKANQCEFEDVRINGGCYMEHSKCHDIHVFGEIKGKDIECRILRYGNENSLIKMMGKSIHVPEVKVASLINFLSISLDGRQVCDSIINADRLQCDTELMCASFYNFKSCKLQELNADFCYIDPTYSSWFKEIHGSLVIIDPAFDPVWMKDVEHDVQISSLHRKSGNGRTEIDVIEADEVMVDHVNVHTIRANRVVIGPNAQVSNIEYREECKAHEAAKVKNCIQID